MNLDELKELSATDSITKAYKYFKENLNSDKLDINSILAKILFVGIDLDENEDEQHRKLLTLGNLTIITQSLNASLRDASWTIKLKGKGDKKGLTAYSAGLETINEYLKLDEWNEQRIDERAIFINDKAKEIWKV